MNTTPKTIADGNLMEFTYKQISEMSKEQDVFVWTQFSEYLGQRFKLSETHIPVELVERMFICFITEHKDEFDALMAKYNGEV